MSFIPLKNYQVAEGLTILLCKGAKLPQLSFNYDWFKIATFYEMNTVEIFSNFSYVQLQKKCCLSICVQRVSAVSKCLNE